MVRLEKFKHNFSLPVWAPSPTFSVYHASTFNRPAYKIKFLLTLIKDYNSSEDNLPS